MFYSVELMFYSVEVIKTSSKRRSDLDYKKWERDMRKPPSSRVHLKRRRGYHKTIPPRDKDI
jgi:hypothetical protein